MSQQKAKETVQRNKELLTEGKSYEFSQKIIMLANRKTTIGNLQEAVDLLIEGAKELLLHKDANEANNLIQKAFENLTKDKQLISEGLKSEFLQILQLIPYSQIKLNFVNKLLNDFYQGDSVICREISTDLINNKFYHIAQKYIVNLNDTQFSVQFLQKWVASVNCEVESEFFIIRYILAKICGQKLEEASTILSAFAKDSPFYNFTQFLLRACKIKSRKAYSKLTTKYSEILKVDPSINLMLKKIAVIYFGYENESSESGMGGLLSSLFS